MKTEILELLNKASEIIKENIEANTTIECVGDMDNGINCFYEPQEDLEDLLFKIGKIIDNKLLIEMFKKPATIEEIIEYNDRNYDTEHKLHDVFDELKHISTDSTFSDDNKHTHKLYIQTYSK